MPVTETLTGAALGAAVKSVVESTIKPAAEAALKTLGARGKNADKERPAQLLMDYVKRTYNSLSTLPALAFQHRPLKLLDVYVPLTVCHDGSRRHRAKLRIDRFSPAFLPHYRKVLLTDTAGMGKSTLLKFLFLSCVHHKQVIPIFVELHRLSSTVDMFDYLGGELAKSKDPLDRDIAAQVLREGTFAFFLDGFDEIPPAEREAVGTTLQSFLSRDTHSMFIVSSRPEAPLALFKDFYHFTIDGLRIEEAQELMTRYDDNGPISAAIIDQLHGRTLTAVKEFLVNPLLVSLLFRAYEHKRSIPLRKHVFYYQVFDALFESHDSTKAVGYVRPKRSGLDLADFHRVLRTIGIMTLNKGRINFERDHLLILLGEAIKKCTGIACKEGDLLQDLIDAVPLFVRDGVEIKWSHTSLQEYFAATFLAWDAKANQRLLLEKIFGSAQRARFHNLLDLYADIDPTPFRQVIGRLVLSELQRHYRSSFVEFAGTMPDKDLFLLKEVTYGREFYLVSPQALRNNNAANELNVYRDIILLDPTRAQQFNSFHIVRCRDGAAVAIGQTTDWTFIDEVFARALPEVRWRSSSARPVVAAALPTALFSSEEIVPLQDKLGARWSAPEFRHHVIKTIDSLQLPRVHASHASELSKKIADEVLRDETESAGLFDSLDM